MRHRTPVLLD
jgi:hypothetical protein